MLEIKVIGIGGIGCALLPFLARYLAASSQPARLTLVDGDSFELSFTSRASDGVELTRTLVFQRSR